MDYTSDPDGSINGWLSNEHPNQHDYDQLAVIYSHLDNTTTVAQTPSGNTMPREFTDLDLDTPAQWGGLVKFKGRTAIFKRDFGGGHKVFTFVILVPGEELK
jgi:hypothetical protein